jgi:hypothetical protein
VNAEQETAMYDQPTLPLDELEVPLEADTDDLMEVIAGAARKNITEAFDRQMDTEVMHGSKVSRKERKLRKRVPPIPSYVLMRQEMESASRKIAELYRLEEQANKLMAEHADGLQLTYRQWVGVKDLVVLALRGGSAGVAGQEAGDTT